MSHSSWPNSYMVKNKTIIGENAAMGSSTDYGPLPNKCLGASGFFCRNNGWIMENMDKELTVPKWVLIVRPKIPQMPEKISSQNVCPSPKVRDFWKKALSGCPQSVVLPIRFVVPAGHHLASKEQRWWWPGNQIPLYSQINTHKIGSSTSADSSKAPQDSRWS